MLRRHGKTEVQMGAEMTDSLWSLKTSVGVFRTTLLAEGTAVT